jgi:hypothetical protein
MPARVLPPQTSPIMLILARDGGPPSRVTRGRVMAAFSLLIINH